MIELLPLAVGLGLAVGLVMTEVFGIVTGGLILPGYMALNLHQPRHLLATLLAALATYALVHAIGGITVLYGRRKTSVTILIGYLMGAGLHQLTTRTAFAVDAFFGVYNTTDFAVVGFVIPGILAMWLERQGIIETLCALWTASVLVRLLLILVAGNELAP